MSVGVKVEEGPSGVRRSWESFFHVMAVELVVLDGWIVGWPFGSLGSSRQREMTPAKNELYVRVRCPWIGWQGDRFVPHRITGIVDCRRFSKHIGLVICAVVSKRRQHTIPQTLTRSEGVDGRRDHAQCLAGSFDLFGPLEGHCRLCPALCLERGGGCRRA